jgi:hypothetical protein
MRDELPPPDADDDEADRGLFEDGVWKDAAESVLRRSTQKRRLLEAALERGKTQVRLDPRRPGCSVPPALAEEPQLALNLSWRFPDTRMVLNERGFAATLRFGGVPHRVSVPWCALWAVLAPDADELRLWPVDVPEELGGPPRRWHGVVLPPVEPRRPSLSVVSDDPAPPPQPRPTASDRAAEPPPGPPSPPDDGGTTPRAPWLRLVK